MCYWQSSLSLRNIKNIVNLGLWGTIVLFFCCPVVLQYLESVRPLLDDPQFENVSKLAAEFESSLGNRLQWYLKLKALWASNYVSASSFCNAHT